jgi:hypothetical protein
MVPRLIGLSTKLLSWDHYKVCFEGMPCGPNEEILRNHGDEIEFVQKSFHSLGIDGTTPYFRKKYWRHQS